MNTPRLPRFTGLTLALALIAGSATGLVSGAAGTPLAPRALAQQARAQEAADSLVPLRRIILYRSGVGAFQRQGVIDGSRTLSLRFETDQINDILKSMVLLDLDGGDIGAVSYASKEPLSRRLASFGIDISDNPSIAELFGQLRGTRIRVDATGGAMNGTILGVEQRTTLIPESQEGGIKEPYVNLFTSGGLRSIAISDIRSFEFEEEELSRELERALAALADHRADRVKTVDLNFYGAEGQARRVVVSYVHEMPVWKTSYRLVLPDGDTQGDPTLQGWAIVENTTDNDWERIDLSLASGRPVGFTMDLYEPLFAPRPEVPVPFLAGIAPRVYEAGRQLMKQGAGAGETRARRMGTLAAEEAAAPSADAAFSYGADDMANYAAAAQASAGDVGEQFMYTLDQPVTLERQRSAMLPILSAAIAGRRVSIYNPQQMNENPMRGVELRNDTSLHLMPGPISVYDGPAYAGDAQIPHTSRGQQQLLSYAVDLDVKGAVETKQDETIDAIRIVNGVVEHKVTRRQAKEYAFTSNDERRERTVIVEHQRNPGWDLIAPEEPHETTDALYRFDVDLPPGGENALTVIEQRVLSYTFEIGSYGIERVTRYARRGKMSKAVADAITKAMQIQAEIARLEEQIRQIDAERNRIDSDQSRLRENMRTIDRNSDLYARYMRKLSEQESRLEEIDTQRTALRSQLDAKRRELENFVGNLNVE